MNYDLAKQLKDAGFPQDKSQFIMRKYTLAKDAVIWQRPPDGMALATLSGDLEWQLAFPTLSELVEACGDKFASLNLDKNDDFKWSAYTTKGKWREDLNDYCESECCGYQQGTTPEEAVAHLWLVLHS